MYVECACEPYLPCVEKTSSSTSTSLLFNTLHMYQEELRNKNKNINEKIKIKHIVLRNCYT